MLLLPGHITSLLIRENGLIETAQVVLYCAGAVISLQYAKKRIWMDGSLGGLVLVFFALRELDFQKKFTEISITRTKFYFSSDVTLPSKLFFGLIVVLILATITWFVMKHANALLTAVRQQKDWAISAATGIACIPLALAADSCLRFLKFMGISTGKEMHIAKTAFEEVTELAIPVMLLTALLQYGKGCTRDRE